MSDFWHSSLDVIEAVLTFLHDVFEPFFGLHSWGWAIIALTLIVRVLLLPLAIKQTRSMRAMQAIQPEMKALQKKYKVDRELMRKDPEQYRAKKAKLNEEMMALYKERGANPAASCLPLLAQAPVFLALFWTLRRMRDEGGELIGAPFYFFTEFGPAEVEPGLQMLVNEAGWPGWLLILLMSGTMYWTQRQMMARTAMTQGESNPMAQQQKILLYAMPIFLAVISFQFPLGILLYWVTTNVWQVAQQAIILREVKAEADSGELKRKLEGDDAPEPPKRRSPGASSGTKPVPKEPRSDKGGDEGSGSGKGAAAAAGKSSGRSSDKGPGKGSGKGSGKSSGKGGKGGKGSDMSSAKDTGTGQQAAGKGKAGSTKGKHQSKKGKHVKNENENRNQQRSKDGDRAAKGGAGSSNGDKPRAGGSSNGSAPGEKPPRRAKRDHLPRRPRP